MKSAFRHLPIRKEDWKWLILMAYHPQTNEKFYFIEKYLPFDSSISCSHFQRVSNAIEFIFQYRTGTVAINYLDDFLFAAATESACNDLVKSFLTICGEINFPVEMEKTEWATTQLVFLGMLLDTKRQVIAIPIDKRNKAMKLLLKLHNSRKTTVLQFQQLTGLLNYLCRSLFAGRAYLRRYYLKTVGLKQYHHMNVNTKMRSDSQQ